MTKSMIMAMMLLLSPGMVMAGDPTWEDVGGGTLDTPDEESEVRAETKSTTTDICEQNDPRMENLVAVLKDIKAGKKVEPLKMSFGTYMGMSDKIQKLLGDNIVIVTTNCKKQFIIDGELTGKVEMPFHEAMYYINDALRARDAAMLKFLFRNVKAAPDTLHNIMSYSVARIFPLEKGKMLAKIANIVPVRRNKESMGIMLLNLYQAMGGRLADGEKRKINIYLPGNVEQYTVEQIWTDDEYSVIVGTGENARHVTVKDMFASRFTEAFASLGIAPIVTWKSPTWGTIK